MQSEAGLPRRVVGRVEQIWVYPVRSLAGTPLPAVRVDADGLAGDRAWTVVGADGSMVRAKDAPAMRDVPGTGEPAADAAAELSGIAKVLVADAPHLAHGLAEEVAALIVPLMENYDALVSPATASGKNVCPRVAAVLDVMQISDITKVVSADTFERPIYAGNAIQIVQSSQAKNVVTVRTSAFASVAEDGSATIEEITPPPAVGLSSFEKAELTTSDRPELASARVVISGGRGLQSSENFKKFLEPVADRLGAALGASRAAVDAGFVPNDMQVALPPGGIFGPDAILPWGRFPGYRPPPDWTFPGWTLPGGMPGPSLMIAWWPSPPPGQPWFRPGRPMSLNFSARHVSTADIIATNSQTV